MPLKNSWIFPIVQSVHICGIGMMVGSILLIDFRRLGCAAVQYPLSELERRLRPWIRGGLAIMLTSGPVLFAADVSRYLHNPAFVFKMAVLLVALLVHFTIHPGEEHHKPMAVVSIVLWTCVVLAGRAIADFDI
jgi:hypothetical protein